MSFARAAALVSVLFAAAVLSAAAFARQRAPDPYAAAVAGMSCKQNTVSALPGESQLDCDYRVGRSLRFAIPGVGSRDVTFAVFEADLDGDYYVNVGGGANHDCAIIKPGRAWSDVQMRAWGMRFAFVSPKNGNVYRDWQSCAAAR